MLKRMKRMWFYLHVVWWMLYVWLIELKTSIKSLNKNLVNFRTGVIWYKDYGTKNMILWYSSQDRYDFDRFRLSRGIETRRASTILRYPSNGFLAGLWWGTCMKKEFDIFIYVYQIWCNMLQICLSNLQHNQTWLWDFPYFKDMSQLFRTMHVQ